MHEIIDDKSSQYDIIENFKRPTKIKKWRKKILFMVQMLKRVFY
jgi:hypothetical protein